MASKEAGGKGEIEQKLDNFVNNSFKRFNLTSEESTMSRDNAELLMKELMVQHGLADAWDAVEFNKVFNLFEEDEPAEDGAEAKNSGLDKNEFTKLVKRIAQL